jgi:hypothetical protein
MVSKTAGNSGRGLTPTRRFLAAPSPGPRQTAASAPRPGRWAVAVSTAATPASTPLAKRTSTRRSRRAPPHRALNDWTQGAVLQRHDRDWQVGNSSARFSGGRFRHRASAMTEPGSTVTNGSIANIGSAVVLTCMPSSRANHTVIRTRRLTCAHACVEPQIVRAIIVCWVFGGESTSRHQSY